MKVRLIFVIALLLLNTPKPAMAQSKSIEIPKKDFWYKLTKDRSDRLQLPNLINRRDTSYWRMWYRGQIISYVIDIENLNEARAAFATFYTEEYVDEAKEKPTNRVFFYRIPLTDSISKCIRDLIQKTEINKIPSEEHIKGWGDVNGLDGVIYCFEYSTPEQYHFKEYWTPSHIRVQEAKIMTAFIEEIDRLIDYKTLEANFRRQVPFQTFNTGGPMTITRGEISPSGVNYKRERENYRRKNRLNN
ncbi:MAG: hypothetical protein V4619_06765 [Bacteroidota bacterium]